MFLKLMNVCFLKVKNANDVISKRYLLNIAYMCCSAKIQNFSKVRNFESTYF